VPRLRKSGAIIPFPYIPSWSAQGQHHLYDLSHLNLHISLLFKEILIYIHIYICTHTHKQDIYKLCAINNREGSGCCDDSQRWNKQAGNVSAYNYRG
jgi:hypothetical protein